jgi:O-acetyl-ADP-ribose deacetylase (regulator of RNase III)
VYEEGSESEAELLACAYTSSLRVAAENGVRSVSFPSISTGAFCYPMRLAAPVAMEAIVAYLNDHPQSFDLVRMVLYAEEAPEAYAIHSKALQNFLGQNTAQSGTDLIP